MESRSLTRPIVNLAVAGIAIGFAIMIFSIVIVAGFKKEISNKVIGFGSHIKISKYTDNSSYEAPPIEIDSALVRKISSIKGIRSLNEFATKAGIIITKTEFEGVVAKGVGHDYDWTFFRGNLKLGTIPDYSDSSDFNKVLVSGNLANKLKLNIGDDFRMYFIQQPPRARKFIIAGIYSTGLEEFDNKTVLVNISHIKKINDWKPSETGGFEIRIKDFKSLDQIENEVYQNTPADLNTVSIKASNPQIFDWLGLQDINGIIIIGLLLIVSAMNAISALLIIILERVSMIGLLKAIGAANTGIRKIFIGVSVILLTRGLIIGNLVGIGLSLVQKYFRFLPLDEASYYISYIPVHIDPLHLILLNAGTLILCSIVLLMPAIIITKISPLKAIQFK